MFRSAIDIAGVAAAAVIAVCLGLVIAGADFSAQPGASAQASLAQLSVNRDAKSDRMPLREQHDAQESSRISVIEVIGVSDAAVVYRDRDGQMLFKTDPVSNVTVVVKNAILPEITIRETEVQPVNRVPVDLLEKPAALPDAPVKSGRMPEGCESAFSTFVVPSQAKVIGRCLSSLDQTHKITSLQ